MKPLLLSTPVFSQLNIDSLYRTMKKEDLKESNEIDGFKQLTYSIASENTTYEFTLDKKGKIAEDIWGMSLIITKLDSIGRNIEMRSYGKDGILKGADAPPIITTKYFDKERMEQIDYYNADLTLYNRIELYRDSLGREIALVGYDKELIQVSKQTTEYLDSENAYIKKFYDYGELGENDCGVSIWYVRFNKSNGFELERRYLDRDSNLVDCTHEDPELVYAYNIVTPTGKNNEWHMSYYTKKGKVVREFDFKIEN